MLQQYLTEEDIFQKLQQTTYATLFGERVAMNMPVQGSAADIIKIAMVKVWERLKALGLKSRLVLQVHDELLIETYKDEQEQVERLLQEEMENAVKLSVPLIAEVHSGNNWYEVK